VSDSRIFPALFLLLGLLALSACERSSQGQVAAAEPARLIPKPCWFHSDDSWPESQCYMMEVPENYAKPSGRKVRFPVVRFKASIPDPAKMPLLHLGAGGPGASMGLEPENASDWLWLNYAKMTVEDGRDLIIMDPRGSGMAEPRLNCQEFIDDAKTAFQRKLTSDEEVRVFTYSMERCYNRLSRVADLAQYNSATVARDVESLREQMGVAQFNLYGVSYASRYALTVARDYPQAARALVLNSAVFPNIVYTQHLAQDTVAAFQRGFDFCSEDKQCDSRFPDLKSRLESLVQALDEHPRTIEIKHHFSQHEYPFVLTGQRLLRVLFQSLYNEQFFPNLPRVIAALESDDSDAQAMAPVKKAVANFMNIVLDPYFGDAAGVSHYCYEEAPFVDFDKARANAANTGILGGAVRTDLELLQVQCRIWAIPGASTIEAQPVHTALPVMLLHGGLDPILAAKDVDKARRELPNHQWLLFPHLAHDVISASNCAEDAAARFLDQPQQPQREAALACRQRELAQRSEAEQSPLPPAGQQP